jgi:hypothetical protein
MKKSIPIPDKLRKVFDNWQDDRDNEELHKLLHTEMKAFLGKDAADPIIYGTTIVRLSRGESDS